jgi:CO/xanthine dehydrogenase FAD-binding subunit
LKELERALVGVAIGPQLQTIPGAAHFASLSPIDDVRATAVYRQEAAQTLLRRALNECVHKVS